MTSLYYYKKEIYSPVGLLELIGNDKGISQIRFAEKESNLKQSELFLPKGMELLEKSHPILEQCENQLGEYFEGKRKVFNVPLLLFGTEFQQKVWQALIDVKYGETRSYLDQSKKLGDPKAIRAVGTANGKNKIPIIIPCHRIIGSDGSLTGYAGGIERKRFLLELERKHGGPADLFSGL